MASIAVWPFICILLGILLWFSLLSKSADDRHTAERLAMQETRTLATAYAQYLTRAIEQIDQLTLLVRYEWENSQLSLEALAEQGLFPIDRYALVTVIGPHGRPVTGNRPLGQLPPLVTDREYFIFHRDNRSRDLRIGAPSTGRVSGKTVIQFTRRLEKADGSFDGVVLVSVEPVSFSSFYDGSGLGKSGLLAFIGTDAVLRMASIGDIGRKTATYDAGALQKIPALDKIDGSSALLGPHWFADGHARFASMVALETYPLVAMVGLSEEEQLAAYWQTHRSNMTIGAAGTAILFLFALVATLLSARLAWRKHLEAEVQEAYRLATEGGNEGFYMLRAVQDRSGVIVDFEVVDCNVRGASFYGLTREQFVGSLSSVLNTAEYFPVLMQTYCSAIESGYYEDELKVPPGSPIKVEWVHRRLVRSGNGLAITFRDISLIKAHERELSRMANEDALTALPNRNWLRSYLPQALESARMESHMVALLFVDLDDFKNVNDSLGHSAGDELLHAAALRLRSVVRPSDHVVRLGGDEFTVILEPVEHEDDAAAVAARIADAFHHPFDLARGKNMVSASIGVSLYPHDGGDAETLLKHADIAMYQAKSEGKGKFHFYESSLSEALKARLDMERALQQAIVQDQFVLHYQPRVSATTGELRALEALVRWQHPELGMVPPMAFISLAEETGLILKLGEIVLAQACAQLAEWKAAGIPLVPVSINVSPYQFNRGNIGESFAACLARHDIDPSLVEIEITESAMIGEQDDVATELSSLREHGIQLLVDDFGTGYSSLSQLQRLDMDGLKIDRAFTGQLSKSPEGEVFFRAIMSMAHALGMSVVAEGVETEEQLRVLQSLSCDEIQGYFISRPVPAAEAQVLMQRRYLFPVADPLALPAA
ncbi:EAL domain-containing protein [Noviherbaspirillum denitrificans]|uniref:bifunctional diguanylate cyclase/phosphodiesterase n=1 Tax=Noviherbaspirillum denitrificans TaxID=1968433 RepID=UPI001F16F5C7|nr:EAL domain-containing protein [Noviherbaspirillum denitrificans]